jgi:predicted O-methyltransferase YrrM
MAMANVTNKIKVFFDDALNVLSKCQYNFDIIYIDADKINYPRYLDLCYNILNNDGIMIFDNIDWYGNIEKKSKDKKTINIQELKNKAEELQILYPKRVKQMTLPIGDGILLIQKS